MLGPSAAAIAYGLDVTGSGEMHIHTSDTGGGTIDGSVLAIKE